MKNTPFKLRSGNTTPFKQMGSSPAKKKEIVDTGIKDPDTGQVLDYIHDRRHPAVQERRWRNYATDYGERSLQSDQPAPSTTSKKTTPKKTTPKKKGRKTYKEAYKTADKSKYKTEAEFITAAKAWNEEKYGTTEPTKRAKKLGVSKESLSKGKKQVDTKGVTQLKTKDTSKMTISGKPRVEPMSKVKLASKTATPKPTRKTIRTQKLKSKEAGLSRKVIKTQKLKSKLEAAKPGSGKAKRLASRYDKKTTVKVKKGKAGIKQAIASADKKFPGGITISA